MAVCRHKRNGSTKRRGAEDGAASVVYVCLCGGVLPIETRRGAAIGLPLGLFAWWEASRSGR
jgi:hypothetical protein